MVVISSSDEIGNFCFMRIADDPIDAGKLRQLFGRALSIAAGDQDARRGIFTMDAPQRLAHVVVGGCGNGTGVEDHQIGGGAGLRMRQTAPRKERFERCAVGLRGAAAEILDEEVTHVSGYAAYRSK